MRSALSSRAARICPRRSKRPSVPMTLAEGAPQARQVIDRILEEDKSRPKKQQHTSKRIFDMGAAGVNPLDWKIRQGQLRLLLRLRFPYVLGSDMPARSCRRASS